MKNAVRIIRSETWMKDDFEMIHNCLIETIEEFVDENEEVINVEEKERNGLHRFWIYVRTKEPQVINIENNHAPIMM